MKREHTSLGIGLLAAAYLQLCVIATGSSASSILINEVSVMNPDKFIEFYQLGNESLENFYLILYSGDNLCSNISLKKFIKDQNPIMTINDTQLENETLDCLNQMSITLALTSETDLQFPADKKKFEDYISYTKTNYKVAVRCFSTHALRFSNWPTPGHSNKCPETSAIISNLTYNYTKHGMEIGVELFSQGLCNASLAELVLVFYSGIKAKSVHYFDDNSRTDNRSNFNTIMKVNGTNMTQTAAVLILYSKTNSSTNYSTGMNLTEEGLVTAIVYAVKTLPQMVTNLLKQADNVTHCGCHYDNTVVHLEITSADTGCSNCTVILKYPIPYVPPLIPTSTTAVPSSVETSTSKISSTNSGKQNNLSTTTPDASVTMLTTKVTVSSQTESKVLTSTLTPGPLPKLVINEIRIGKNLDDNYIELQGENSTSDYQHYVLYWFSLDTKSKYLKVNVSLEHFTLKNGVYMVKNEILQENLQELQGIVALYDARRLDKSKGAYSTTGLVDAVAYGQSYAEVNTTILKMFMMPLFITDSSIIDDGLSLSLCASIRHPQNSSVFITKKPTPSALNACPVSNYSRQVKMMAVTSHCSDVVKDKNASAEIVKWLVHLINRNSHCLLSKFYFEDAAMKNCTRTLQFEARLFGNDSVQLTQLYTCYWSIFKLPQTFSFSDKIAFEMKACPKERCTLEIPEIKKSGRSAVTIIVVCVILVLFLVLAAVLVLYMKRKKKNILHNLSVARYDADNDDLLVDMDEMYTRDDNFRNPTYN